jgi:glucose-6-phosphate dehydrogenase assembly protein OpcA
VSTPGREVFGGFTVDYEGVEAALGALWKSAAEDVAAGGRPPVTRVTTVNVIVLAGSEADAESARELAGELCARHPGRMLVVRAVAGPDGVTAEVSAQCHLAGGGRQVCSEQVVLTASGRSALEIAQLVAPLLLPDLPVVLCLPGHPLVLPVDDDLLDLADRVVVDARGFPDTAAALARLGAWIEGRHPVVDLAWLRLERWRALTAQLFDEPAARRDLERLESVEVEYLTGPAGSPEGRAEALYYVAWIVGRLRCRFEKGLHPDPGGESYATRRPDGGVLALRLSHAPRPAGATGDLSRIRLAIEGGAHYDVHRLAERQVAEVRVAQSRPCPASARVGLATRELVELLSAAMSAGARDPMFEEALAGARALSDAH